MKGKGPLKSSSVEDGQKNIRYSKHLKEFLHSLNRFEKQKLTPSKVHRMMPHHILTMKMNIRQQNVNALRQVKVIVKVKVEMMMLAVPSSCHMIVLVPVLAGCVRVRTGVRACTSGGRGRRSLFSSVSKDSDRDSDGDDDGDGSSVLEDVEGWSNDPTPQKNSPISWYLRDECTNSNNSLGLHTTFYTKGVPCIYNERNK